MAPRDGGGRKRAERCHEEEPAGQLQET
jgi:hypothetical protein